MTLIAVVNNSAPVGSLHNSNDKTKVGKCAVSFSKRSWRNVLKQSFSISKLSAHEELNMKVSLAEKGAIL